jgi:hypothetical protein
MCGNIGGIAQNVIYDERGQSRNFPTFKEYLEC